jgi:very-short-patch-repair endonuclease
VDEVIRQLAWRGGTATRRQLACRKTALVKAMNSGVVVRDARGRYALAQADSARRDANRLAGARSHTSAALAYGWSVARPPERTSVTVPRGRLISPNDQRRIDVHWRPLSVQERNAALTSPVQTVLDCCRVLPFGEALAVADSAVRAGDVGPSELARAAEEMRGPGCVNARRVATHVDGRSANPFESMLRAICLGVRGTSLRAQVRITAPGLLARVDLADETLRLVVEADSYQWHGGREALARDARRYDELVSRGWTVLRFAWEDVFFDPEWVQATVQATVDRLRARPKTTIAARAVKTA